VLAWSLPLITVGLLLDARRRHRPAAAVYMEALAGVVLLWTSGADQGEGPSSS